MTSYNVLGDISTIKSFILWREKQSWSLVTQLIHIKELPKFIYKNQYTKQNLMNKICTFEKPNLLSQICQIKSSKLNLANKTLNVENQIY